MAGPVQTAADEAKRTVLAIGAQQGDKGVAAYNDALKNIDQVQTDAMARAGAAASGIAAPTTAAGEMSALYSRPTATAAQLTNSAKASFQANSALSTQGTTDYLTKLGAVEPVLDKYLAAKLAAAAGSGGGGSGGGGSGGGGGGDLSDSEMRVQLKGAADESRQSDIDAAMQRLKAAGGVRSDLRISVKNNQIVVKKAVKTATGGAKRAQTIAGRVQNNKPTKRQAAKLRKEQKRTIGDLFGVVRSSKNLANTRKLAQAAARNQRSAYSDVVATAHAPLDEYAKAIGNEAGVDPSRVAGLFGPTEQASFRNADKNRDTAAGGNIGLFGRAPTLGPRAAAHDLKVPAAKAKVMRTSKNYRQLADDAEAAIRSGKTFDQFQAEVRQAGWFEPRTVPVLNGKGQQRFEKDGKTKATRRAPALGHVANLVLLDYAPSFGK